VTENIKLEGQNKNRDNEPAWCLEFAIREAGLRCFVYKFSSFLYGGRMETKILLPIYRVNTVNVHMFSMFTKQIR